MVHLKAIDNLLEHIEEVQSDVIVLSDESLLKMTTYIEKHNIEVDDEISIALQYQDIITQQLNSSLDTIESMRKSIEKFSHTFEKDESLTQDSINELENKLAKTLLEAKERKNRFSGKTSSNDKDNEIEFF